MDIFLKSFAKSLNEVITELTIDEIETIIEVPEKNMGDFAFPCFKLSKIYRKPPQMIAKEIVEKLNLSNDFCKKENVGGYINVFINKSSVQQLFYGSFINNKIISKRESNGKTIAMDYSSPNIAKPIAFHHIRSTVIGNSIGNLFEFLGYNIARINYLGDWGTQFGKLTVAFLKWGNEEELSKNRIKHLLEIYVKYHKESEKDPSLDEEARKWFKKCEDKDVEALKFWKTFRDISIKEFEEVYKLLNVKFTHIEGESYYSDVLDDTIKLVQSKLNTEISEGALIIPLEDMPPVLLKKMDGATLYATRDIAAAIDRYNRFNFDKSLYIVATQQQLHFKQVFKVIELMGFEWFNKLKHIEFGMVKGMSTREGNVVFLEDVLRKSIELSKEKILEKERVDENRINDIARIVGVGAIIFGDLKNSRINDFEFNWDELLNFAGYTGPNIQYSYARIQSIIKKSEIKDFNDCDITLLKEDSEIELMKTALTFESVLNQAAESFELYHITKFLYEISKLVATFHHSVNVIKSEENVQKARLFLLNKTAELIKTALSILSMEVVENM